MDAILGLLGICGANCAEDRDPEVKAHAGEVVSAQESRCACPCVSHTALLRQF